MKIQTLVKFSEIGGTSFVGVRNYTNSANEISNQTFVVGINYTTLLNHDLKQLKSGNVKRNIVQLYKENNKLVVKNAYNELVLSLTKRTATEQEKEALREQNDSTINRSDAQTDAYVNVAKGLRLKDNELYLFGLMVNKKVITKGEYKEVKQQEKTIIKDKIKRIAELRELKLKNFKLGNVNELIIRGVTIS